MKTVKSIEIEFESDSLFGNTDPEKENIDVGASIDKLADMVLKKLTADFPEAKIEIETIPQTVARTKINGSWAEWDEFQDERETIDQIIADIWETWDWIVQA